MTLGGRVDGASVGEESNVGGSLRDAQGLRWRCHTKVEKWNVEDYHAGGKPYAVEETEGNILTYGGADVMWLGLKAGLSASTGLKNTYFNNANAAILVGDSTTAAAATQTDLIATSESTNRCVKGMEATFPTHTTGAAGSTSSKMLFKSVFSSAFGNFAWREWGIGNHLSSTLPYPGRLLNRKVQNLGTKTSAGVWALTITLSLA